MKNATDSGRTAARTAPAPEFSWFMLQHRMAPYLFVAPFLVVFGLFGLWPIAKSLILSPYTTAARAMRCSLDCATSDSWRRTPISTQRS